MKCINCGSENVKVQVVNETNLKTKHHSLLWWVFIGIWWIPIKWFMFFWIALIVKIFGSKKYKTTNKQVTMAVCQDCGNTWKIKE